MKTSGEMLVERRRCLGFELENISKKLKIQPKYLMALEKNDYSVFDSRAIAQGFLKKYSNFLGLDTPRVIAFWRRDFTVSVKSTPPSLGRYHKYAITPRVFILLISVLVVSFFIYTGVNQNATYNSPPKLEILSPVDGEVVEDSKIVLRGKVSNNSEVWVNSRKLKVKSGGRFSENLLLHKGINRIMVKVLNPSDLEEVQYISVENRGKENDYTGSGDNKIDISLESESKSSFVEVKDSSKTVYRGFLLGPSITEFKGNNLTLYIDSIEGVKVRYNDKNVDFKNITGGFYTDFTKQQ